MEHCYDAFAEDQTPQTRVTYPSAPNVKPQVGMLPFVAPSAVGVVYDIRGHGEEKRALVRFEYKNATGGYSWSEPIEVSPGQLCSTVIV